MASKKIVLIGQDYSGNFHRVCVTADRVWALGGKEGSGMPHSLCNFNVRDYGQGYNEKNAAVSRELRAAFKKSADATVAKMNELADRSRVWRVKEVK